MPRHIRHAVIAAVALSLAGVCAAPAQAPQPGRIRATIETMDGAVMHLKLRDGGTLAAKIAADSRVSALVNASLADIKADSFIGVAGLPRPDGSIVAFSVHIFMASQRGVVADRHFAWDAQPGSTMTNAYVTEQVMGKDGGTVTVKYKDGQQKILITPETVIAAVALGSVADLKPGAGVVIFASDPQADGSVVAKSINVGRDVMPAM
jgi:hypothetical protein